MTIKELHELTTKDVKISFVWGDVVHPLTREDSLMLDAFGSYVIDKISTNDSSNEIQAELKAIPEKKRD